MSVRWLGDPEDHDYDAALDYLTLEGGEHDASIVVKRLRGADTVERYKAKDILRSSTLPLLPLEDPHVFKDFLKMRDGKALSPVLLVSGIASAGVPLTIADGYHRVCAVYHYDYDAVVPCRLVEW